MEGSVHFSGNSRTEYTTWLAARKNISSPARGRVAAIMQVSDVMSCRRGTDWYQGILGRKRRMYGYDRGRLVELPVVWVTNDCGAHTLLAAGMIQNAARPSCSRASTLGLYPNDARPMAIRRPGSLDMTLWVHRRHMSCPASYFRSCHAHVAERWLFVWTRLRIRPGS